MNDDEELQKEIDKVSKFGGGIIELERRNYFITKPIILRNGVTLLGKKAELEMEKGE